MGKYYEDYKIGEKTLSAGRTVTEGDLSVLLGICRFIDPFMIDEEAAKKTVFGGRIAPGRLIIAFMGGQVGLTGIFDLETTIANMGFDSIRFKNPLRAGDTIRTEVEIIRMRETSKPDRGLVTHREVCRNQKGEILVESENTHLVMRRPK